MALTILERITPGGPGNFDSTNLYYEADRQIVINQKEAVTVGLINVKFQGKNVTVFAAKNKNDLLLEYMALPCPPYYHEIDPAAFPGNVLI